MMHQMVLTLILLFSCAYSAVNYHQRRVYYSQNDNVCTGGAYDRASLTIRFDDRQTVQKTITAGTTCNTFSISHYNQISPLEYTVYEEFYDDHYDQLILDQKGTRVPLESIVMKLTVRNPGKFDSNRYNCDIEGDGTVQHFGPIGTIPAPNIIINCKRIKSNMQIEQV